MKGRKEGWMIMPGGPGGSAGSVGGGYWVLFKCNGRVLRSFSQASHI